MGLYNIVNQAGLQAGQPEDISVVLANLQAIQAILNGGLDNANINAAAAIAASKLAGYPGDVTKSLLGDGTWGGLTAASTALNIGGANTDLAAPTGNLNYWVATTAGGSLRSIGAGRVGARITLKNGTATGYISLLHATAGGGAQLTIINAGNKYLAPGQSIEFEYDGAAWVEVNRPAVEQIFDFILTGAQATIDSNTVLGGNIPQVYSHLLFKYYVRGAAAVSQEEGGIRLNNDAVNGNYHTKRTWDNNAGWAGDVQTGSSCRGIFLPAGNSEANVFGGGKAELEHYTNATNRKSMRTDAAYYDNLAGPPTGTLSSAASGWESTAAVIRAALLLVSGSNMAIGSRFGCYGIT